MTGNGGTGRREQWDWKRPAALGVLLTIMAIPLLGLLQSPPTEVQFDQYPADAEFVSARTLDVSFSRSIADIQIDRDALTLTINRSYEVPWEARINSVTYPLRPGEGPYVPPLPDEPGLLTNTLISLGFAAVGTAAIVGAVRPVWSRSHS